MDLKDKIRQIPNFPKEGIVFRDITTLIKDKDAFKEAVDEIVSDLKDKKIDYIVGPEARGFLMGSAVAYALGVGFVPVRKKAAGAPTTGPVCASRPSPPAVASPSSCSMTGS